MTDKESVSILIVDDQPAKLLSLETVLADLGEHVMTANSADRALKLLLEHEVAVVLVDVCMPHMDGFELAELIRQHPRCRHTAIIFISAVHLTDHDRLRGYRLGAVDYIPVPLVPEVLRAKVAIFVELYRKTQQLYRLNDELEQRVAERTVDLVASSDRLRDSEQRYRRLVHILPAAVYTCDADGRISLYNQAAADLWGRVPEVGVDSWCGSWRMFRLDGAPIPADESPMAVLIKTGAGDRTELIIERPDGTRRTVISHPELILDSTGQMVGAVNMLEDVTDTRRAEQAQSLLAEIVASSEDAIISTNLDGRITSWNNGAEWVFGYSSAEVVGEPIFIIFPPDRRDEEPAIIERLRRGERVRSFETVRVAKDGRHINVSLTVSPVRDSNGQLIGISKAARDITERKKAEEVLARDRETLGRLVAERTQELALSVKRLRLADRMAMIGTLSAGLGHDMGNLLLPIRMRLDSIEAADISSEVLEDVLAIRKASEYLQRLAASLRLLALDPESESQLHGSTDLAQWWYEAEGMIRNGVPRTVELKYVPVAGEHVAAVGKAALTQMIFNLVQNAGDALKSKPGGQVTIAVDRADGMIQIRIIDDGPGMSEEDRRRCLEPFFTTKTRGLSTGLGLALVGGLAAKAGGNIQVDSVLDRGTTITLNLPVAKHRASHANGSSNARSAAVVTVVNTRLGAHVRSLLKSMDFDVLDMDLERADLWVTECRSDEDIDAAKDFVASGPLRRAFVFTPNPDGVDHHGITFVESSIAPSALRTRMYGLLATQS